MGYSNLLTCHNSTKVLFSLEKLSTDEGSLKLCITENIIFRSIAERLFYST